MLSLLLALGLAMFLATLFAAAHLQPGRSIGRWARRFGVAAYFISAVGVLYVLKGSSFAELQLYYYAGCAGTVLLVIAGAALGGGVDAASEKLQHRRQIRQSAEAERGLLSTPDDDRAGGMSEVGEVEMVSRVSEPPA